MFFFNTVIPKYFKIKEKCKRRKIEVEITVGQKQYNGDKEGMNEKEEKR